MFPSWPEKVSNYVLHKLAHFPASKENVALKFSGFLSFLCVRNLVLTFVQYVN